MCPTVSKRFSCVPCKVKPQNQFFSTPKFLYSYILKSQFIITTSFRNSRIFNEITLNINFLTPNFLTPTFLNPDIVYPSFLLPICQLKKKKYNFVNVNLLTSQFLTPKSFNLLYPSFLTHNFSTTKS